MTEDAAVPPKNSDGLIAAGIALGIRLSVVVWAARRFPPAEDGRYYEVVAARIAEGKGYTWLWPDGAVTYAAHYPVGYPALLGALYAAFGAVPAVAMCANALFGALAVLAVHRVAAAATSRNGARFAAWALALHPALVFYTPAIMTEGVALSLLVCAAWAAVRARTTPERRLLFSCVLGVLFGVATLVRPQSLLLAPVYGFLAVPGGRPGASVLGAALVAAAAVGVCLPWTFRNCTRMHACFLVSANAGWNLFIGSARGATGSWVSVDRLGVPSECRTVWDEAKKDACFGAAARREISENSGHFLSLVPQKLAVTFDYAGAAGWYLHSSNPEAFTEADKTALGVAETLYERLLLLLSLIALARIPGSRGRARIVGAGVFSVFLFLRAAWVAHLGVVAVAALLGKRLPNHMPAALTAATIFGTALTHAIFFGGGRYSLVCFPLIAALAGTAFTPRRRLGSGPLS